MDKKLGYVYLVKKKTKEQESSTFRCNIGHNRKVSWVTVSGTRLRRKRWRELGRLTVTSF